MRLIDADELLKQAYDSHQWNNAGQNFHQMVVDALDIEEAPTIDSWHYPSKGEVPKNNKIYILADRSGEEDYCVMYYEHRKDEDVWGGKFTPPYMWQYIIPPQEEV